MNKYHKWTTYFSRGAAFPRSSRGSIASRGEFCLPRMYTFFFVNIIDFAFIRGEQAYLASLLSLNDVKIRPDILQRRNMSGLTL